MRGRKTIHHLKKFLTCAGLCLLMAAAPKTGLQAEAAEGSINVTYMVTTARPDAGSTTISAGKTTHNGKTGPVRTGDASLPMAYFAVVAISAGLILLILLKDKKEEKEEESAF